VDWLDAFIAVRMVGAMLLIFNLHNPKLKFLFKLSFLQPMERNPPIHADQ
jgi:hypothetical protein